MAPFYVPLDQIKPLKNLRGQPFVTLWQAFPWLTSFYSKFEMSYDGVPAMQDKIRAQWQIPLVAVGIYALVIFGGRRVMRDREPFDLRNALAVWNGLLAAFSIIGAVRTVPYLFYWLATIGPRELNCRHPSYTHGERDIGFWVMLFIFSKLFELIDTVFIVLRKRPLIFLHWYHHITVLLFCWYSSAFHHAGLVFVAMNYSVHAVMYSYFFLMAVKAVPKWFNPLWITIAQISQMFVGVGVTAAAWRSLAADGAAGCPGAKKPLLWASMAMYGSYLYLFVEFAVLRFIVAPRKRAAALKAKQAKEQAEPPTVRNLLKKVSSMVTGTEPGADPASDGGVPLLRPRLTAQESAYSYHFELPSEGEGAGAQRATRGAGGGRRKME